MKKCEQCKWWKVAVLGLLLVPFLGIWGSVIVSNIEAEAMTDDSWKDSFHHYEAISSKTGESVYTTRYVWRTSPKAWSDELLGECQRYATLNEATCVKVRG